MNQSGIEQGKRNMKKILFVINTLGCGGAERAMLDLFDAFDKDELRIENGTSFQFGTVFDSDQQPVFTIHGAEFYSEDGKRYNRFSEIPVNVVVCYWYNDVPRGWFMKLTNHADPKKPLILELENTEVDY